jgi:prevent-host-death family protein
MTTVTVTQAKNNLLELLREAEQTGQSFQITRKGRPAGVLVSADEWESLIETVDILSDAKAMQKIARARRELSGGRFRTHQEVWGINALPDSVSSRRRKGSPTPSRGRRATGKAGHRASRRRPASR